MSYICYSGGAVGADAIFSYFSIKNGFKVVDFSFDGHTTKSENRYILSKNQLKEGFEHIKIANERLGRNIKNAQPYVRNLISRDWFQAKNAEAIFAIGELENETNVRGGTGYCISTAIDNNKPIYLFEQSFNQWYYYDYESNRFEIYEEVPTLTKKFAGIGTRKINDNGIKAIESLFNNMLNTSI